MDCYPIVLLILRSSNVMGTSALWGEMLKKTLKELGHLLIYLLLCSNHLHALHCLFCSYAITFWAAAPKGMKSCRTQGESVCMCVCTSPPPHPQGFVSFGAQIQAKWPKSSQNGPNPGKNGPRPGEMDQIWLGNLNSGLSSVILAP